MSLICIFAYVCVFLRTSYVPVCCAATRATQPAVSLPIRPSLPAVHLFTTVWPEVTRSICCFENDRANSSLSRLTFLGEDRHCCESWRDAELRVHAVCAMRDRLETRGESGSESPSDTTGEVLVLVRWVVLLFFSPHHDTAVSCLTNDTLTTDCYDDWWRQAWPIVRRPPYDASSPFRWGRLHACCPASVACR